MKAIWSFWTKPFNAHREYAWVSQKQHLLSWVLSLATARAHYPDTALYTDDDGVRLLVDGLGLEFGTVSTALNHLDSYDPGWWALGKIYAYRLQREPFIHIDNDVFLWKPLPPDLEAAPVLAQNPEPFRLGASYYHPDEFEFVLKVFQQGWLPPEWEWYIQSGTWQRGECCGILGGNRVDFLNYVADLALRILDHPRNQAQLAGLSEKIEYMLLLEQYLLAACIDYHRGRPGSPYGDIEIAYLFPTPDQAFDPAIATQRGYTHLIADAKRNPELADRLERRVQTDYPDQYERCLTYLQQQALAKTA